MSNSSFPSTSSASPAPLPYWRLSSFYFLYFSVLGALTPYLGVYLKSLGYNSRDVGIISAIVLGTRIIAPNFWGWLADKYQARLPIIRLGSVLAFFCFVGIFIHQTYTWLVVVISSYTFFWHAIMPQFEVVTLRYLGDQHHRYAQIRLWGSVGFVVSVAGLGWLFDIISIHFLPLSIIVFLILICFSSASLQEQRVEKAKRTSVNFFRLVWRAPVISFLLANFLLQISFGPYYTYYSLYLTENYGYSRTATGLLWALGVIAEISMFAVMPRVFRAFSLRHLLMMTFLITGARWLMIGYGAQSIWLLLFAQLLHAFSFGVAHASSIEIVRIWFKGEHQSQGQALYSSFSFGVGGSLGALIAAYWWDQNASLTFLIAGFAVFLAFVITYVGLHLENSVSPSKLISTPAE